MATAHRGIFPRQMDRRIVDMFMDKLTSRYSEYEKIAKQENFPKGREYRAAAISGLGDVETINEGGRPTFDIPAEGNEKAVEATKYGLGFMITEEMVDDDFHGKIEGVVSTLSDAAVDKVNKEFYDLFINGNDTHRSWDNKYIVANDHTTLKSSTTLNNLGAAALSETAFQAAFEYFDNVVDEAGRKTDIEGDCLLVPVKLRWMANRLLRQMGGYTDNTDDKPSLGLNDMTTNPENGYVNGWQLYVLKYLTDDADWWFISKKYHEMKLLWKKRITMQSSDDWQTDTKMYKVTFRVKAAAFDYRGVYGYYS